MTQVYCFSAAGHSMQVAESIAEHLGTHVISIPCSREEQTSNTAIVVFPVYCQNIPKPAKKFLCDLQADQVVLAATYGKISHGNVLHEAQTLVSGTVIAGAYIPTGHTYLCDNTDFSADQLGAVFDRITAPKRAVMPVERKGILADFFPAWRSRIGVKIILNDSCCQCGRCTESCPTRSIMNGIITSSCIRCMRCVSNCPEHALEYTLHPFLARYLSHTREDRLKIYL